MDEIPAKIKAQGLQIARWTLVENQQLMKLNLETDVQPQMVNINAQFETCKMLEVEQLLK